GATAGQSTRAQRTRINECSWRACLAYASERHFSIFGSARRQSSSMSEIGEGLSPPTVGRPEVSRMNHDEAIARNSPALIGIEHVSVQFSQQRVLQDLTLSIERGKTLVVIGESGCGKTVLLKLIIGLLRPTAGRVTFDGRVLTDLNERDLTRQRLRF